jgi:uncharacterized protein
MALAPFLLEILVCPETKAPLSLADDALLARLNSAIDKGKLADVGQKAVTERLAQALVRAEHEGHPAVVYPVWDDVPRMLVSAQIPLHQLPR